MVDYAFFLIYLVEFLLRVYTYGLKVLKSASPEDMQALRYSNYKHHHQPFPQLLQDFFSVHLKPSTLYANSHSSHDSCRALIVAPINTLHRSVLLCVKVRPTFGAGSRPVWIFWLCSKPLGSLRPSIGGVGPRCLSEQRQDASFPILVWFWRLF